MKLQKLYSYIRQAVDKYNMIEDGDKIAIGISGGKDSLTLLYGLAGLQKFYPKKFSLVAITVDLGYGDFDLSKIEDLCKELSVPYYIVKTEINKMVGNGQCSLCARLRKGAFNDKAKELGCNKIAYAHNMDDVVETMLLSLIYEGRFSTFYPVTELTDEAEKIITLIRPLIFAPLSEVVGFQYKYNLPVTKNPCPYDKTTERTYVRELLKNIDHHAPGVRKRMMTAIMDGTLPMWVEKKKDHIKTKVRSK